jgi:ATP-dependent Clp protease ATP-binding subunit ClpA
LLTNGLRDKPESVVLFDEVEKAHKTVFDVVLRFLDEGQIADPAGPIRDGRRCIIVLTSNLALATLQPLIARQTGGGRLAPDAREAFLANMVLTTNLNAATHQPLVEGQMERAHLAPDGRDALQAEIRAAILADGFFRPEFINRVDELILFASFDEGAYRRIIESQIADERSRLRKLKGLDIQVSESLVQHLVKLCLVRADQGARACHKLVSRLIVVPMIDFFLDEKNAGVRSARVQLVAPDRIEVVPEAKLAEEVRR